MPWHLSRSDPRKIYDSFHQAVCICQTPDQAALIVRAVNQISPQDRAIELRERLRPTQAEAPHTPMNVVDGDACCGPRLVRALAKDLTGDSWTCPQCSCEWTAKMDAEHSVRRWSPVVSIEVLWR